MSSLRPSRPSVWSHRWPRLRACCAIAALASVPAALPPFARAAPVPVVDRGPDLGNPSVANVRVRDLGGGYYTSGSSQFSTAGLPDLLGLIKAKGYDPNTHYFVDVDLRQEWHGFINAHAVRWMEDSDPVLVEYDWVNLGKARDEILAQEPDLLKTASAGKTKFYTHPKGPKLEAFAFTAPAESFSFGTEADLVKSRLGEGHYIRLTIPDHLKPATDRDVDLFTSELERVFVAAQKEGKVPWIHFHCAAGQGRTTTFMTLYEFYVKVRVTKQKLPFDVPVEDIALKFGTEFEAFLAAQKDPKVLLGANGGKGGADLTFSAALRVMEAEKPDYLKGNGAIDRFRFILNFYWYLTNGKGETWSAWSAKHGCGLDANSTTAFGFYPYCAP